MQLSFLTQNFEPGNLASELEKHARDEANAQLLSASGGSKKALITFAIPSLLALTLDEDEPSDSKSEGELAIMEFGLDDDMLCHNC